MIADARTYLVIVAAGFFFSFFNQIFTGMFTAMGGSVVVLRSTAIGLVGNIILDPLMIFGIGHSRRWAWPGAATATVLAQAIVTAMFLLAARREMTVFPQIHIFQASQWRAWAEILKIGLPVSIQSMFFSGLSMDPRQARRGLGGRRYRGSEGRFADRVHLLYHGGGICHGGQRIYRTKLRRGPDGAHP